MIKDDKDRKVQGKVELSKASCNIHQTTGTASMLQQFVTTAHHVFVSCKTVFRVSRARY